ncbi:MAG: hypothetical protein FD163_1976 [Hyphomonadaceae bacterium]|nr:MAG: hypothetical protein FD128_2105 [Hyphomonadaceae bacterium]KAF0184402.1 MAG: hypothetical protein FD163_1976 [Hyphomonadaceae bacterium]
MDFELNISKNKPVREVLGIVVLSLIALNGSLSAAQPATETPPVAIETPVATTPAPPENNVRLIPRSGNLSDALGPTSADDIIPALPQVTAPIARPTAPPAPTRPPTREEIAREIAPNFNVATDYNRLVQCYGTADYMAAFTRVRANRPGATPQIRAMATQISGIKTQMQPFVLAASTIRTEARFRADYDRVARNVQNQIAASRNPDPIMQAQLRTLNACQTDIRRWRGGQ